MKIITTGLIAIIAIAVLKNDVAAQAINNFKEEISSNKGLINA